VLQSNKRTGKSFLKSGEIRRLFDYVLSVKVSLGIVICHQNVIETLVSVSLN